jgi:hypothetical protein
LSLARDADKSAIAIMINNSMSKLAPDCRVEAFKLLRDISDMYLVENFN